MKFKHFALFATAAAVLAGCDGNSKLDVPEQFGENDILVSIEDINGTKSALSDDVKTIWSNGDVIKIYSYDNSTSKLDSAEYAYSEDVEPGKALFIIDNGSDGFSISKFAAAYYPGENAISYNPTDKKIAASVASSQTYAANSFGVDAAPMASNMLDNSGSTPEIRFRNAFAVIKLNLTGTSKISEIRVSAPSLTTATALSGTFNFELGSENTVTVSKSNANDAGYELVLDCSSSATLTSTPTPFYIAVPGMPTGTKMAVEVSNKGVCKQFTTVLGSTGNALVQNNIVSMPSLRADILPGALPGLFSISETKQVNFSMGNLQYLGSGVDGNSTAVWRFAEHQYDYMGAGPSASSTTTKGNVNISGYTADGSGSKGYNNAEANTGAARDWFAWGTSGQNHGAVYYQPWSRTSTSSNYYAYGNSTGNLYDSNGTADWGYNAIANGGNTTNSGWRTLKSNEFTYLINSRSTTTNLGTDNARFSKVTVNSVNGLLIFPDVFTWNTTTMGDVPTKINNTGAGYSGGTYTAEQFQAMEAAGVAFLPAAGVYSSGAHKVNSVLNYWWSDAKNESNAQYFLIEDATFYTEVAGGKYMPRSVRLVLDASTYNGYYGYNQDYEYSETINFD